MKEICPKKCELALTVFFEREHIRRVLKYVLYIFSFSLFFYSIYKSIREKKKKRLEIRDTYLYSWGWWINIIHILFLCDKYVKVLCVRVIFTVHHLSDELPSIAVSACILDGFPRNSVCEIAPRCIITRIRFCSQQSPLLSTRLR